MAEVKPLHPERGNLPIPEAAKEQVELASPERKTTQPAQASQVEKVASRTVSVPLAPVRPVALSLSPLQQEVENILAEGLQEFYLSLTAPEQQVFKTQGEATAIKISVLLSSVKVKFSEILKLIREWLRILPGLNKYFIEQSAKIKADKILKLH